MILRGILLTAALGTGACMNGTPYRADVVGRWWKDTRAGRERLVLSADVRYAQEMVYEELTVVRNAGSWDLSCPWNASKPCEVVLEGGLLFTDTAGRRIEAKRTHVILPVGYEWGRLIVAISPDGGGFARE